MNWSDWKNTTNGLEYSRSLPYPRIRFRLKGGKAIATISQIDYDCDYFFTLIDFERNNEDSADSIRLLDKIYEYYKDYDGYRVKVRINGQDIYDLARLKKEI